jgi:hypothetical protein
LINKGVNIIGKVYINLAMQAFIMASFAATYESPKSSSELGALTFIPVTSSPLRTKKKLQKPASATAPQLVPYPTMLATVGDFPTARGDNSFLSRRAAEIEETTAIP